MQITTGIFFLVEFDQHVLPAGFARADSRFPLPDPSHQKIFSGCVRRLDLLHPIENRLIGRFVVTDASGRRNGRSDVFHDFAAPRRADEISLA